MSKSVDAFLAGMQPSREAVAPAVAPPAGGGLVCSTGGTPLPSRPRDPPLVGPAGSVGFKYVQERLLGRGATGTAHLVRRVSDNATFVAKVVDLDALPDNDRFYALCEAHCLGRCDHFAIIRLIEAAHDPCEGTLTLILEHGDAGDLRLHIKHRAALGGGDAHRFSEKDAWQIFVQMCLALDHVHARKMLHRDVKTQNIYLTSSGLVKLGDFGLSAMYDESVSRDVANSVVGTPSYIAPELMNGKRYGKKADMWSLGCVLFEILALRRPFEGAATFDEMRAMVLGAGPGTVESLPATYSVELRDVAVRLMNPVASERPSASELLLSGPGRARLDEFVANAMVTPTVGTALRESITVALKDFMERHQGVPRHPPSSQSTSPQPQPQPGGAASTTQHS